VILWGQERNFHGCQTQFEGELETAKTDKYSKFQSLFCYVCLAFRLA